MAGEHQEGIRPVGCKFSSLGDLAPNLYTGELVIVTDDDTTKDVIGLRISDREPTAESDLKIVPVFVDAPSKKSSTGYVGQIAEDDNYLYICTATNTWKRVEIKTW